MFDQDENFYLITLNILSTFLLKIVKYDLNPRTVVAFVGLLIKDDCRLSLSFPCLHSN